MTPAHEVSMPGQAADLAPRLRAGVPVVDTPRLRLRAPVLEDFPVYAGIACGPRGAGIGGPMTREDAFDDFAKMVAGWLLRGHGLWTIDPRAGGAPLGFVLIGFEPGDREPELGFMLTEAAEGRGIAAEAAAAARDHGFGALGLPSMASYIARGNARSQALAERLDARLEMPADWDDPDTLVYRHPRPEVRQ